MKIVVRMRGGLGNQLFILAYAYYLLEKCDANSEIILDLREYEKYKVRNFELSTLIHDERIKVFSSKDTSLYYDITRTFFHFFQKLIRKETNSIKCLSSVGLYYGRRKGEYGIVKNLNKIYVYGYFQDARMVNCVRSTLISKMIFIKKDEYNYLNSVPSIAVSIRCGQDYVAQGWPICSKEYYVQAIETILNEKYKNEYVSVLVFSDDICKAKEMIQSSDFNIKADLLYIENLSSVEQLSLMRSCNDFVISNSSFSWWGAYIGSDNDSIVIMPSKWYRTGEDTDNNFLVYNNTRIIKI